MTDKPNSYYHRLRRDIAGMLGYSAKELSVEQAMRVDAVFALKLSLDALREKVFAGQPVDTAKMLAMTETLEKYLPPKPPPPVEARATAESAKAHMMRLILSAIRAEKNKAGPGRHGAVVPAEDDGDGDGSEVERLRRTVELQEDEIAHLRGKRPRQLPKPGAKPMKAAAPEWVPAPEPAPPVCTDPPALKPAPPVEPAARPARNPSEGAWNAWRNAGGESEGVMARSWIGRLNAREW